MKRTLSFAKPIEPDMARCDPGELFEKVCAQFRGLPGNEEFAIEVSIADDHPGLLADWQLLEEVLINLVQNAAEACDREGKVRISCERSDQNQDQTFIEVEDDGPGIPPQRRNELFKLFHTTKSEGTGMGLAFCRKVIEAHGGALDLVDGSMGGACFRMELGTNNDGGNKP